MTDKVKVSLKKDRRDSMNNKHMCITDADVSVSSKGDVTIDMFLDVGRIFVNLKQTNY